MERNKKKHKKIVQPIKPKSTESCSSSETKHKSFWVLIKMRLCQTNTEGEELVTTSKQ